MFDNKFDQYARGLSRNGKKKLNLNFKKVGIQMFAVFKWSLFRFPWYLNGDHKYQ